jgi:hypothetical protein
MLIAYPNRILRWGHNVAQWIYTFSVLDWKKHNFQYISLGHKINNFLIATNGITNNFSFFSKPKIFLVFASTLLVFSAIFYIKLRILCTYIATKVNFKMIYLQNFNSESILSRTICKFGIDWAEF